MPDEQSDLKNSGGGQPSGSGQTGNEGSSNNEGAGSQQGGAGNGEETVTIKKSELEKIQSDRDNYREGLLKKKVDERTLGNQDGGGDSKQGGGSGSIDETKVKEIAKAESGAVLGEIHKSNESRAKRAIMQKYSDLVDDTNWVQFMAHFAGKRGKATTEDIMDDFEDAMLLYKRSTGKLEEHLKAERARGVREGRIQAELESGRDAGGAGDRGEGGKSTGTLTPKGEEMARGMHVDLEKAKKVDPSKDNVLSTI